jgi:hypothetical protein
MGSASVQEGASASLDERFRLTDVPRAPHAQDIRHRSPCVLGRRAYLGRCHSVRIPATMPFRQGPQPAEAAELFLPSRAEREAVELAARVVALLDTRKSSIAVDSSEADDYDGSVSVSEWLKLKAEESAEKRRRARLDRLAIVVGLALAACVAIIMGIGP